VNMFSVLEENKTLRQQLEKTTEKVSHDVLVEVLFATFFCPDGYANIFAGQSQTS
jgi:hypothetical protein